MNTYVKFAPNVFVAKCKNQHQKGDEITVTTKRGKENQCIVFNCVGSGNGFFYYSIIRADGFNTQEWAKRKSEKFENAANNSDKKSSEYYEASKEGADFLSLGEPIKIGHHSEKRHRNLIERNWNRMEKSVQHRDKAEEQRRKAEYYKEKENVINLSMPESIEFYEYKLEEAKMRHEGLKNGTIKREHSFSLTYAKKDVNKLEKQLELAKKLWE